MRRVLKIAGLVLLIFFSLIVLLLGLAMTSPVQTYVARHVLAAVNRNLTGSLAFDRVHATIFGTVTLHGLRIADSTGRVMVSLDKLDLEVNPLALRRNRISIRHITADGLATELVLDSTGSNIQRALAPRHPSPPSLPSAPPAAPWRIRLGDTQIHGVRTVISRRDTVLFETDAWDLKASGRYAGDSLKYAVNLQIPRRLDLTTDGTLVLAPEFIPLVGHLSLLADTSMIALLPAPANTVGATSLNLSFVSSMDSLKLNAQMRGRAFGIVNLHGATVFPVKDLALRGEVTFDSLTPGAMWADTTDMLLSGNASFSKKASSSILEGWDALVNLTSSHYGIYRLASAKVALKVRDSTATITGNFDTGHGRAKIETVVHGFPPANADVTAKVTLDSLDLRRLVLQIPDTLLPVSGVIDAHFIATKNVDLQHLTADVRAALGSVTLGSYSLDSLLVVAHVRGPSFQLDTLHAGQGGLRLQASAAGRLDGDMQYAVAGTIPRVQDLKKYLPATLHLSDTLGGSIAFGLSGSASLANQRFSRLVGRGSVRVDSAFYGADSVRSVRVDLHRFDLDSLSLSAGVDVRDVKAAGQSADSVLLSVSGSMQNLAAALRVWARADTIALATQFQFHRAGDKMELTFDTLSGHYSDLDFATSGENAISLTGGKRLEVSGITIVSNVGVIRAQGTLQRGGEQDFALELSGLRPELLAGLLKIPPTQAIVNLRVQLLGPDSDLTGDVSLTADSISLNGQPIADQFTLHATSDKRHTVADGQMNWLGDTTLLFTAEVPARISIEHGLTVSQTDSVHGRLQLLRQRMEKFNRYLSNDLKLGGFVSADMRVGGTMSSPSWDGSFTVEQGTYNDPRNGIRYKNIDISGNLVGDTLRIPRFDVTSSGKLSGSGWAKMALPLPSSLHLDLKFDHFQALNSPNMRIKMSGNLALDGPLNALNGTGRITVDQSLYRLTASATKQIEPIDVRAEIARMGGDTTHAGFGPSQIYSYMSHRVGVSLPGDTWIRGQGINIELTGDMEVDKQRRQAPELAGEIDINRGTVTFYGHEFQVEGGTSFIRFNGPSDNPELDITATDQRLADQGVEISIRVFGTLKQMQLSLAGSSGADSLSPAQIAQLLAGVNLMGGSVPGQPRDSSNYQQKAEKLATGAATGQLSGLIGRAAGLDVFKFNPGGQGGVNGLTAGSLEVGTYLTNRLFVQVVQPVRAEIGSEQVSVEYRLFRWLNLRAQRVNSEESAFDLLMRVDWR